MQATISGALKIRISSTAFKFIIIALEGKINQVDIFYINSAQFHRDC